MGDAPPDVLAEARALVAAGFSVIPIDPRTKQPYFNLLPKDPKTGKATWNPFRERLPTEAELTRWFDPRAHRGAAGAMALACGPKSDGVLCLDFDVVRFFDDWMAYVGALADGLVIQKTGGGRRQVFFRCPAPGPNTTLAWMEDESQESGRTIAIETRGDGGYACLPPSLHPSGGRYQWIRGTLLSIPRIPQAHADALLAAARKLDECPHTKEERKRIEAEARGKHDQKAKASRNGSSDIIGQFNERHSLTSVLETHGYTETPGGRYCRPGREGIASISIREGRSVHFSTNDPLNDGALASGYGCHDAFDVFRMLEHGGDAKKAVKAAAEAMGLSLETKSDESKGAGNLAVGAIEERRASQAPPVPLGDLAVPPLPPGVFTGWLGAMIDAVAAKTETPPDAAALFALGTISCAVQGCFTVRPESGYFEPLSSYSLLVMESGNRKTAVQGEMAGPLVRWEQQRAAELEPQAKRLESERKTVEVRLKRMREAAAKERSEPRFAELSRQVAELEAALPQVPKAPRLFSEDVTAEHLGSMLADNGERLAILSDEGGIFDLMAGRYSNGVPNIEIYLKGHSGSAVRVDRGTRTPVVLAHPTLTICCSPQPDVLRSLTKVKGFRGRGLLARFWYAIPRSRIGYRELRQRAVPAGVAEAYERNIHHLLASAPQAEEQGGTGPRVLSFSAAAWGLWKDVQRSAETMMRPAGKLAEIKDWGSKFPGAVARIAGLLHCAQHAQDLADHLEVGEETMARAAALGWYFVDHALAAFDVMGADDALDGAKRLWGVIEGNRQERFTARDAWHPLRNGAALRTVEQAEPGFRVLLDHGYLYEPPAQPQGRPGRPSRFFLVNPHIVAGWGRGESFGHIGHDSLKKSFDKSSSSLDQYDPIPDLDSPGNGDQKDQNPVIAPEEPNGPLDGEALSGAPRARDADLPLVPVAVSSAGSALLGGL